MQKLKIFISYSWDNEKHISWVKQFSDDIESYEEFHVILDQYDLDHTTDKNYFMEKGLFDSDIILIIATQDYANKANNRKAGVGIETFLTTSRYWDEMTKYGKSNIIAVLKDERECSIPNYLKGKFDIDFRDGFQYQENLKKLISIFKDFILKESKRPKKTKIIYQKKHINYLKFDRVDDILAINYKNRKQIETVTDYSNKHEIKYEYWKIDNLNYSTFILVLFQGVNLRDTIGRFIQNNKKNIPNRLVILRTTSGKSGYIEDIFNEHKVTVTLTEYTIEQFVWEECIDQEWKKENQVVEDEFFIDQRLYKLNEEDNTKDLVEFSLNYIKNNFLVSEENSILMIFASGGMGKSTLSQVLTNKINEKNEQKALLIQSEIIRNNVKKDAIKNFEINNLYELYSIYLKFISENKSALSQKQFELGVLTGRIIVVIDGLDEIISLFHENFHLEKFVKSLDELNTQLGKTKVIITSRLNILHNNSYLVQNDDVDIVYLQGFEEDIWKKYVISRFGKYQNTEVYLRKIEKYLNEVLETNKNGEKVVLPFFLDLISEVVEDEIKNNDSTFIVESLKDEYLSNQESIDYLIFSIFKREIRRQKIENINVVDFMNIFKELAVSYGDRFSTVNLKEYIEIHFNSNDTQSIYQKMLLNPLLKVDHSQENISFRYDFLLNYFCVLYMIDYLSSDVEVLDQNAINVLAKLYDGTHTISNELVKYFSKNTSVCVTATKKIIKLIDKNVFKKEVSSSHKYKKIISALLYITQNIFGQNLSRDKRIDIIKDIYGEHKIEHLYIWGDFYPLDFSNIQIWTSEFYDYSSFDKSKFVNAKFYYSFFSNIELSNNCEVKNENFDKDSCTLGSIESFLKDKENKSSKKKKVIEEEFLKFCRNFYNGIKFESKLDEHITLSPKMGIKKSNIIDQLIMKDFLEKEPLLQKKYYKIKDEYHRSVKNFIANDAIDRKLLDIVQSLV
jgi:hypothetical protein